MSDSTLPQCEFRVHLPLSDRHYCRHSRVHTQDNTVANTFCAQCSQRQIPCTEPRPIPDLTAPLPKIEVSLPRQAWNVASSLATFICDGMRLVDKAEYERRLNCCDKCSSRLENRCIHCGCVLTLKAAGLAFQCPIGKWDRKNG